ncbi:hypothetical protein [Ferribacterium limneticum]|uniref:hypothetical protein n=1 Tax=Ferribacterium limneticum TaxID=76259 RepID=UPI001CFA1A87|nr:hypothetical protein [Ferribacterium limneticum]UCV27857.1 hypothetical protein KI617_16655 [Ferribacterium limneticum]UCV31774.1 hypothetical protein KI608_16655 [Ferribacterium limneticum]
MSEQFEQACSACRYFRAVDALTGACHRFPPIFAGESSPKETHHWRFPIVSLHAWCGEFRAQTEG